MAGAPTHKVLIVDDESQILMLLKATLEKSGFAVTATNDPRRVQELALRDHPHLVLSDLMMPFMDGYGVAASLRKDPRTSTIPIAFLTAAPTSENLPKAFSHGVVGYFEKPFHPAKLGDQLRRLLQAVSDGPNKVFGSLRNTPLDVLLQSMIKQRRTGVLNLTGQSRGQIVFRAGAVIDALYEGKRGADGVDGMRGLTDGEFELSGFDGAAEDLVEVDSEAFEEVTPEAIQAAEQLKNADDADAQPDAPLLDTDALEMVERVLVIDDDPSIAQLLAKGLVNAHFEVDVASNGALGLEKAIATRPDLILCDIMMPEMDGWQLFHRLRSDYRINETRFVFLSCYSGFEDRLKALGVQAEAYLAKGILLSQVMTRIAQILEPRRAFRRIAEKGFAAPYNGRIAPLGIKFVLSVLANSKASGELRVENVWHKLSLRVSNGQPVAAEDQGLVKLTGFDAFLQLCGQSMGEITFEQAAPLSESAELGGMSELMAQAEEHLTVHEQRVIETQLVTAPSLRIDPQLLDFYMTVAPERVMPILQAVKQRLSPRDIIASLDISPLEIEEVLKDLVRKRIVLFEPQNA